MSIATLILGESGSGKSCSLRHLPPDKTLLVQCISKPLPFRAAGWHKRQKNAAGEVVGNITQTASVEKIIAAMQRSAHEIVVIDDYQAVLLNELMARSSERGYEKFVDIAKGAWEIFQCAGSLAANRRVYILAHTQSGEDGHVRMKTVGRMVDEKIVPEGWFTIVLKAEAVNGNYLFATQSNGKDCCKSPMGLFAEQHIENDLAAVDSAICGYYAIETGRAASQPQSQPER